MARRYVLEDIEWSRATSPSHRPLTDLRRRVCHVETTPLDSFPWARSCRAQRKHRQAWCELEAVGVTVFLRIGVVQPRIASERFCRRRRCARRYAECDPAIPLRDTIESSRPTASECRRANWRFVAAFRAQEKASA